MNAIAIRYKFTKNQISARLLGKKRVYRKENKIIFRKCETMRNNQQYVATSTESICQYSPQETVEKFHYQAKATVKMAVHEALLSEISWNRRIYKSYRMCRTEYSIPLLRHYLPNSRYRHTLCWSIGADMECHQLWKQDYRCQQDIQLQYHLWLCSD